jgi:deazaflavin-dependent oxidoreductase (nitroreductase family)
VIPRVDRFLHRVSRGRLPRGDRVITELIITTTGSRTGRPRQTPLAYLARPGGAYLVVGSNFGRPDHPAWTDNLLQQPAATVAHDGRSIEVRARLLEGDERTAVWPALLGAWPPYRAYEARSGRTLRVFELTPVTADH